MKPTSFVPMVGEISAEGAGEVPGLGAVISYWTDDGYSAEEWFRELNDRLGDGGFRRAAGRRGSGSSWSTGRPSVWRARRVIRWDRSTRRPCCWPTPGETRARAAGCW